MADSNSEDDNECLFRDSSDDEDNKNHKAFGAPTFKTGQRSGGMPNYFIWPPELVARVCGHSGVAANSCAWSHKKSYPLLLASCCDSGDSSIEVWKLESNVGTKKRNKTFSSSSLESNNNVAEQEQEEKEEKKEQEEEKKEEEEEEEELPEDVKQVISVVGCSSVAAKRALKAATQTEIKSGNQISSAINKLLDNPSLFDQNSDAEEDESEASKSKKKKKKMNESKSSSKSREEKKRNMEAKKLSWEREQDEIIQKAKEFDYALPTHAGTIKAKGSGDLECVRFSGDDTFVFVGNGSASPQGIRFFSVGDQKEIGNFHGTHSNRVRSCDLSPDASLIVSGGSDHRVVVSSADPNLSAKSDFHISEHTAVAKGFVMSVCWVGNDIVAATNDSSNFVVSAAKDGETIFKITDAPVKEHGNNRCVAAPLDGSFVALARQYAVVIFSVTRPHQDGESMSKKKKKSEGFFSSLFSSSSSSSSQSSSSSSSSTNYKDVVVKQELVFTVFDKEKEQAENWDIQSMGVSPDGHVLAVAGAGSYNSMQGAEGYRKKGSNFINFYDIRKKFQLFTSVKFGNVESPDMIFPPVSFSFDSRFAAVPCGAGSLLVFQAYSKVEKRMPVLLISEKGKGSMGSLLNSIWNVKILIGLYAG